jgi:peptidyl-prolyl cis-trans isomerase C
VRKACGRLGLGLMLVAGACNRNDRPLGGASGSIPEAEIVARIDGQPITRGELDKRLADRSAFVRARYTAPEKRRELLDSVVRFEVLAREAQNRGYDRDPEVLRYRKQRAIERMLASEVDAKLAAAPITREELEAYHRAHPAEFRQPEGVRVDQIVVSDARKAGDVAAAAKRLGTGDAAGFRKLVATHSEDEASAGRGGDLGFLQRGAETAPHGVIEGAFALAAQGETTGPVAGPIKTEQGYHIIRLTQRRPSFVRPFEDVEPLVRTRLIEERRRQRIEAMIADVRSRVKVEVFEDRLEQVDVKAAGMGQDASAPVAPLPNALTTP